MKKAKNYTKWIVAAIAIALNLFILINAFIPGGPSGAESNTIAHMVETVVNGVKPETITESNFDSFASVIRKLVGHFGLFCVDAIFSTISIILFYQIKRKFSVLFCSLVSGGFGLVIATISELIQIIVPGRVCSVVDIAIDFGGYFIGGFVIILIFYINSAKNKDKKTS